MRLSKRDFFCDDNLTHIALFLSFSPYVSCQVYLAPWFHLPPEGAHLHQAGHRGGRFDGCTAAFLWHHTLHAMDELDTGHSPMSHAKITGR